MIALKTLCFTVWGLWLSSQSFAFYNEFGDVAAHVAYQNSVFYDVFVSDTPNFRIDKGTLRSPMQSPLYSMGIPRTSSGPLRAAH